MEKKLHQSFKRSSLALSIAAVSAALTIGSEAAAQQQQGAEIEEITVTGSRIRMTSGMTTPVPVTALTTEELSNFDPGGTVAQQLDSLPQFFDNNTAQKGGGALFGTAGGSYLNMRDLGRQRTLVLLDGTRVVPADKRGAVNVDTFPTALIQTVDVVTGGASAAYGADALGGVTNFVLDREFQGIEITAGTGITEWGDGERWNLSIAGGRQFGDRLNVVASFDAKKINPIIRNPEELDPEWFRRWGHVTNPAWSPGDTSVPQRLTLPWVCSSEHSPYGLIRNTGTELDFMKFTPDGSDITPFIFGDVVARRGRGSTRSMSGGPECDLHHKAFEGGPEGSEVVGRSGFLGVQYQFTDSFSVYGQAMVGRSESNILEDGGRSGYSLQDLWFTTIRRDNAFLPDSVARIMDENGLEEFQMHKLGSFIGVPEIGINEFNHNVFVTESYSAGFDAILPNGWSLEGSWQTGESHKVTEVNEKIRVDRMFLGMDAVRDPANGSIVCRVQLFNPTEEQLANTPAVQERVSSRVDIRGGVVGEGEPLKSPIGLDNTIRDCVPYNVMGNGNISKAAIDYTGTPKIGDSIVEQDFGEILLTGEVYGGWGYGPVNAALGATWREQSFSDGAKPVSVDALGPPLNAPELGIRGIPPGFTGGSPNLHQFSTVPLISGSYDVWEVFGELNAPIWESSTGFQSLTGSLAYRSSEYSRSGRVESWKLGLDFQVFNDLRLRATKSRDVREPNFSERFDAQGGGGSIDDPRFGGQEFQITSVSGGNPDLEPEKADTVVAGFVYQPSWLPGLQWSTDWYEVEIQDAVGTLGLQRIVDECEINNVQQLCTQITRDANTGVIGRIFNVFLNVAQANVEGVDMEVAYQTEPDLFEGEFESLNIRGFGGYIIKREDTPFGGVPFDQAGQQGTPKFTGNITATYTMGPYGFQLQGQHIDSVKLRNRWVEGIDVDDNTVSSQTWWNASLRYQGDTSAGATWRVSFNVNNILDQHPPIVPDFSSRGGSQDVESEYEAYGRRYQLSVNYNF